MLTAAPWCILS